MSTAIVIAVVVVCLITGVIDLATGHGGSEEDYHRSGDDS